MKCELWRRFLYWFILRVYFARVTVLHAERQPKPGPVLYLGLHRNGAVDGWVYHHALGEPTFMISTQLRKNWLGRMFFTGIAVTRTKDEGERGANDRALQECVEHLRAGGSLFVFPEGTSSLGPRHLPFKSGALWLIQQYLELPGPPLQVIPVGIHYECPWAFRAKVEVVLGRALDLAGMNAGAGQEASALSRLKELKRRAQAGLEEVGINVISEEYQGKIQRLAYISTLATPCSYFESLKVLEKTIPEPILQAAERLDPELQGRRLLRHQDVPLVPMSSPFIYLLALLLLAPVVALAMILNAPPLLASYFAGRKFPDGPNVISLWKILVGVPALLLWIGAVGVACLWTRHPGWLLGYGALTWVGLELYYRVKKLGVAVYNGFRYPQLRPAMLAFRETVLRNLPGETLTRISRINHG